jgi:hypothetical protein
MTYWVANCLPIDIKLSIERLGTLLSNVKPQIRLSGILEKLALLGGLMFIARRRTGKEDEE